MIIIIDLSQLQRIMAKNHVEWSIHNSVNLPVKLNFVPLKLSLSSRHAQRLSLWKPAEKKLFKKITNSCIFFVAGHYGSRGKRVQRVNKPCDYQMMVVKFGVEPVKEIIVYMSNMNSPEILSCSFRQEL
jgi:hypothetical protein